MGLNNNFPCPTENFSVHFGLGLSTQHTTLCRKGMWPSFLQTAPAFLTIHKKKYFLLPRQEYRLNDTVGEGKLLSFHIFVIVYGIT